MIMGMYEIHFKEINITNRVCNYYFDNLFKEESLETKNILINEKNYKDLVIYSVIYIHSKSIKMFKSGLSQINRKD